MDATRPEWPRTASNKTAGQAAAEFKVPAKYVGYLVTIDRQLLSPEAIFQIVYDDLKK